MTHEEKKRSYERYEQYRDNRARYEAPAGAVMFVAIVGGVWILFKTGFSSNAFFLFLLAVVMGGYILYIWSRNNKDKQMKDEPLNEDITIRYAREENKMESTKWTDIGSVNANNQRNNGKTEERGTDNGQWFYEMECLNCGHKYKANGSDIWQRKCPNCQGGRP